MPVREYSFCFSSMFSLLIDRLVACNTDMEGCWLQNLTLEPITAGLSEFKLSDALLKTVQLSGSRLSLLPLPSLFRVRRLEQLLLFCFPLRPVLLLDAEKDDLIDCPLLIPSVLTSRRGAVAFVHRPSR